MMETNIFFKCTLGTNHANVHMSVVSNFRAAWIQPDLKLSSKCMCLSNHMSRWFLQVLQCFSDTCSQMNSLWAGAVLTKTSPFPGKALMIQWKEERGP